MARYTSDCYIACYARFINSVTARDHEPTAAKSGFYSESTKHAGRSDVEWIQAKVQQ